MSSSKIPLPEAGIDVTSPDTNLLRGNVREANNVNIAKDGSFSRRDGYVLIDPTPSTGLFNTDRGLLVGMKDKLYTLNLDTLQKVELFDMNVEAPIDFTTLNGDIYVTNGEVIAWHPADGIGGFRSVGVIPPEKPTIAPIPEGKLVKGKYALALSIVDRRGEESSATFLGIHELQGGFRFEDLSAPPAHFFRLYITPPDGDILYLADEWPTFFPTYIPEAMPTGGVCETLGLSPLPAGRFIRGYKSRLFVARGDVLFFSEPMRPRSTKLQHNFVRFVGEITFIEPVDAGIYVADERGVWFLVGENPEKMELRHVSEIKAIPDSSVTLSTPIPTEKGTPAEGTVAVWLSVDGYVMGDGGGQITPLTSSKSAISRNNQGKTVFTTSHGKKRITTLLSTREVFDPARISPQAT